MNGYFPYESRSFIFPDRSRGIQYQAENTEFISKIELEMGLKSVIFHIDSQQVSSFFLNFYLLIHDQEGRIKDKDKDSKVVPRDVSHRD